MVCRRFPISSRALRPGTDVSFMLLHASMYSFVAMGCTAAMIVRNGSQRMRVA